MIPEVCFAGSAGTQPILEKTLARSDLQLAAFGRNTVFAHIYIYMIMGQACAVFL